MEQGLLQQILISKVIYIEGPYAKGNGDRTQFRFVLDRSAWQNDIKSSEFVHELKQQIKEAIICLDSIECFPIVIGVLYVSTNRKWRYAHGQKKMYI